MPVRADHLQRLRVATATGRLPPDLGRELLEILAEVAPVVERMEIRNQLLREAGALMNGTRWSRACRLACEIRALEASPGLRERAVAGEGVRELVARALEVGPAFRETSPRHLLRLLAG